MQDFWTVAEIAERMRWPVYKTRRRLARMRVIDKQANGRKGQHYLVSRDKLRVCWPDLLDALHRRTAIDDNGEQ